MKFCKNANRKISVISTMYSQKKSLGAIIGILIAIIFVSGCGNKNNHSAKNASSENSFSNKIQEALQKNKPLKCVSEIEGGKIITYLQGKNIKTESEVAGKTYISIMKESGDNYSWIKGEKKGQKFNPKCMKEISEKAPSTSPTEDYNSSVKKMEVQEKEGQIKCSPVSKIDFDIPQNISFIDQCQLMKQQMEKANEKMQEANKQMEQVQKQMKNIKLPQ